MGKRESLFSLSESDIINEEVFDWYTMSPIERFIESQKLWDNFILLGGSFDPEPDSQSPFYIFEI